MVEDARFVIVPLSTPKDTELSDDEGHYERRMSNLAF